MICREYTKRTSIYLGGGDSGDSYILFLNSIYKNNNM